VIEVSVTPLAVAPLAVPGPQGEGSVPNICVAAAVVGGAVDAVADALDDDDDDGDDEPWLALHATAKTASAAKAAVDRLPRIP